MLTILKFLTIFSGLLFSCVAANAERGLGPQVIRNPFQGDMSMLMSLFGPRTVPKDDLLSRMPDCERIDRKSDLDKFIHRDVPGKQSVTLVWFYNNTNMLGPSLAEEYNRFCSKNNNIDIESGDDILNIRTVAFDMIDTRQMDDRKMKVMAIRDYDLSGHVHDMEFVLFWGHIPPNESVKFTSSGDHDGHHSLHDVASMKQMFLAMNKWFRMLTQPVRVVKSIKGILEFFNSEHPGPSAILKKANNSELLIREKFYHLTPDVAYTEVDTDDFDETVDDESKELMEKLGLAHDWWTQVDLDNLFVVKNHHAFDYFQDPLAYPDPRQDGQTSSEQKIIHKPEDLVGYLPTVERADASKNLTDPQKKYSLYEHILSGLTFPLILSTVSAEDAFKRQLPIYFIAVNEGSELEPYFDELLKAAEKLRGRAVFMVADGDETKEGSNVAHRLFHHLNIENEDIPALRLLVMRDRGRGMWEKDKLFCPDDMYLSSSDKLIEYMDEYSSGAVRVCVRSEPIHDDMHVPGEPEILVGENFHEQVFEKDIEKDLLIDAYAPWCGHCKAFEPQLRKLADFATHIPNNTLRITKIDATRNDLPGIGQLRGYPSILFFPGGSREHPIEHRGSRAAEDLLKWIADRATNKFDVSTVLENRMKQGKGSDIMSREAQIRAVLDEL